MEERFLFDLHRMVANKSEEFQDEFFKRIQEVNCNLNRVGTTLQDYSIAATIMLNLELEKDTYEKNPRTDLRN